MHTRSRALLIGAVFAGMASLPSIWPESGEAYLATPSEIRSFWYRQRELRHELYLAYEVSGDPTQRMHIYSRPDGLWGKRIQLHGGVRETWKWGLHSWHRREDGMHKSRREKPAWDDWVFEPNVDVLLEITPQDFLRVRGLGRHEQGYTWVYGARQDQEPGPWFALLKEPIRMAAWHSDNPNVGNIEFLYEADGRLYPDKIIFHRADRAPFILVKTAAEWHHKARGHLEIPSEMLQVTPTIPRRVVRSVTEATIH